MRRFFAAACVAGLVVCVAAGGPARAQGSFDPAGVGDLNLWLDGADVNGDGDLTNNPAGGEAITRWVDKSGEDNDVIVQANSGAPSLTADAIRGRDAVTFEAAGDRKSGEALNLPTRSVVTPGGPEKAGMTAFFAGASRDGFSRFLQVGGDADGGDRSVRELYGLQTDSSWRFSGGTKKFARPGSTLAGGEAITAAFSIPSGTAAEPLPQVEDARMFLNGVEQPLAEDLPYGKTLDGAPRDGKGRIAIENGETMIGAGYWADYKTDGTRTKAYWSGDMGELLVYQGALSDSARREVTSYLQDRWVASAPTPATLPMAIALLGGLSLAGRRRRA